MIPLETTKTHTWLVLIIGSHEEVSFVYEHLAHLVRLRHTPSLPFEDPDALGHTLTVRRLRDPRRRYAAYAVHLYNTSIPRTPSYADSHRSGDGQNAPVWRYGQPQLVDELVLHSGSPILSDGLPGRRADPLPCSRSTSSITPCSHGQPSAPSGLPGRTGPAPATRRLARHEFSFPVHTWHMSRPRFGGRRPFQRLPPFLLFIFLPYFDQCVQAAAIRRSRLWLGFVVIVDHPLHDVEG